MKENCNFYAIKKGSRKLPKNDIFASVNDVIYCSY